MNTERLVREVERRLKELPENARAEVLDALREEIGREKRRTDPTATLESERARRVEAETLREILEAINRQARLQDTIEEVLKQLSRTVVFDSCSIALLEAEGTFRIFAAKGFPEGLDVVGTVFQDPLSNEIRDERRPISLADVQVDDHFSKVVGTERIRSWAGIPLLVEGEVIGLLSLDRHRVQPFDDEDLYRAKAVAFSAAAAIRKARLLDQVRRYAALMERTVAVDQAVFAGRPSAELLRVILEGAAHLGSYPAGLLLLCGNTQPTVAAVVGDPFADAAPVLGRTAPSELLVASATRVPASGTPGIGRALGIALPAHDLYLVPLQTTDRQIGGLVLLDPNGQSADDRLMEAYASRAAIAYLYAQKARG
jgi:hypothetical protein